MQGLSDRINLLIKSLNITKTKFADCLHVSPAFVTMICSGKSEPSDRTIADICREFNVNEKWLRTGEDPMFVPMTRTRKIAEFMQDALSDTPDSARATIVSCLAELDVEDWEAINKILKKIFKK